MVDDAMIISSKLDGQGGESEATEKSDDDDTLSEEGKEDEDDDDEEEEDVGAGAKDEERRLLDELEGLEEAEEEEYSGPLLAEEEEEEDDDNDADEVQEEEEEEVDDAEHEHTHTDADAEAEAEAEDGQPAKEEEEEEEEEEYNEGEPGVLDFLTQPPELDPGTPEEQAHFTRELEQFFASRKREYRPPKFYGENLNLLKLWRTVIRLGAYNYVTAHKLWRQVGETFKPPKKCTTVSWSFRIFYEKSLLEYERHMLRGTMYSSGQVVGGRLDTAEGPSGAVQNGASQPQGRARRDAAMRAMQGWHSQRILENEDAEFADPKERSSMLTASREKQPITGVRKRRNFSPHERSVKGARFMNGARAHALDDAAMRDQNGIYDHQSYNAIQRKQSFKQGVTNQVLKSSNHNLANGADIRVADEGPEADWVKINVHRTCDCFEVYALVPGLLQEELRIQCEPGGLLVIIGEPEQLNNPWGVTPFKKVIKLPSPIDANSTSAVITLHGQLFVRVPYGESHT